MAFKMGVSKDKLEGMKPVPNGVYEVVCAGFEQKLDSKKTGINLNPILKIINHPEFNGQRIWYNLSTKAAWLYNDFCHCFGLPVEIEVDPDTNEEVANLPGGQSAWVPSDEDPENVEKARYTGPLVNATGKVEVIEERKPGQKPRNVIKMFLCNIDGCAQKYPDIAHNSDLTK